MILFAAAAVLLLLLTLAMVLAPLLLRGGREQSRAARDAAVFRDQLAELDRDIARGLIAPEAARGSRAEIARRLLSATAAAERASAMEPAPWGLSGGLALAGLIGLPLLGLVVYLGTGKPGMPDVPFAGRPIEEQRAAVGQAPVRPSQADAERRASAGPRVTPAQSPEERRYAALVEQLEKIVAQRPDDVQGLRLLADARMRLGRAIQARQSYDQLAGLLGNAAPPDLLAAQAEAMVMAAGGYVSPEAEQVLARALTADPSLPNARYYAGVAMAQAGRLDEAVALWERLKADSPPDAPWLETVEAVLAEVRQAGLSRGGSGPSAADIEAAQEMSPEDRQAMIAGMVARLESRLTEEGGPPEDWVRLINAQVQLGRRDDARRIYVLSQQALSGSEAGFVREQALILGVAGE